MTTRKYKQKALRFAQESTYGVDAVDGNTQAIGILGRDVKITPMAGENTSLEYDNGELGNSKEITTNLHVTLEFAVDFAGSGTAATMPQWAKLLPSCMRSVTEDADNGQVLCNINTSSTASGTFYFYLDGVRHAMVGARGSVKLEMKAGAFPQLMFSFTGLFTAPTTEALPAIDFSAWKTPLKVGAAYTSCLINGYAAKMVSLDYDQANEVGYLEYVGHEEVQITDFAPTSKLVLEAEALADFNPYTLAEDNTEVAFEVVHGIAGNQVIWKTPRLQLGRPEYGDHEGVATYEISLRPLGDDDQIITK